MYICIYIYMYIYICIYRYKYIRTFCPTLGKGAPFFPSSEGPALAQARTTWRGRRLEGARSECNTSPASRV